MLHDKNDPFCTCPDCMAQVENDSTVIVDALVKDEATLGTDEAAAAPQWAVVELMGHVRLVGILTEESLTRAHLEVEDAGKALWEAAGVTAP